MKWFRHVYFDLTVTALIVIGVLTENVWLRFFILAYTPLILFVKVLVLLGNKHVIQMKKLTTKVPQWFNHLLYAINTSVLLLHAWWFMGGLWVFIWMFSWVTYVKFQRNKKTQKKVSKKKKSKAKSKRK